MDLHFMQLTPESRASHIGAYIESPGKVGSAQITGPHPQRFSGVGHEN